MSLKLSPEEAAAEVMRRRAARNSLVDFARAIDVPGAPIDKDDELDGQPFDPMRHVETELAPHHLLILNACERTILKQRGRLMIFMPPGSAKSTYVSVVLPAYCMGRWPGFRVIAVSYASDLARKMGRRTRSIIKQPKYQSIFGASLSDESGAADEFSLTNKSEYMSAGILSGITGNRAHAALVDDPIKGRQDAESEVIRKRTMEEFDDSVRTRVIPSGAIIMVTTRWHEDDPAGQILPLDYKGESGLIQCRDGQEWEVICLPAKAERQDDPLGRKPGEYLWPQWFGQGHWGEFERKPRTWASLYQQRPAPEEGDIFQAKWLIPYEKAPALEALHIYGASDYAVTKDGGDYTVHIVVGIDAEKKVWLLDLWRGQTDSSVWIDVFCDLVKQWKPLQWAEETGQINSGVGPFKLREMRKRRAYTHCLGFASKHDKTIRAQSIRGLMATDGLHVPVNAPWYEAFRSELLTFPTGRNDDQVDALSLVGQLLDMVFEPNKKEEDKTPKRPTEYRPAITRVEPADWMAV